jgi:hypothetical protein
MFRPRGEAIPDAGEQMPERVSNTDGAGPTFWTVVVAAGSVLTWAFFTG